MKNSKKASFAVSRPDRNTRLVVVYLGGYAVDCFHVDQRTDQSDIKRLAFQQAQAKGNTDLALAIDSL
jgi:hypothetical protein